MKKPYLLVLLLLISGFISAKPGILYALFHSGMIAPGLVFGLALGIYFKITSQTNSTSRLFVWIICSIIAYYAAFWAAVATDQATMFSYFSYAVAGFVGSLILVLAALLIKKLNFSQSTIIIVLGTMAGFVFGKLWSNQPDLNIVLAYIIWQLAVGIPLGVFTSKEPKYLSPQA